MSPTSHRKNQAEFLSLCFLDLQTLLPSVCHPASDHTPGQSSVAFPASCGQLRGFIVAGILFQAFNMISKHQISKAYLVNTSRPCCGCYGQLRIEVESHFKTDAISEARARPPTSAGCDLSCAVNGIVGELGCSIQPSQQDQLTMPGAFRGILKMQLSTPSLAGSAGAGPTVH